IDVALSSATELCAELGSRLRSQRLAMRIPQEELAKRAGLNVNTIRNVEGRTGTASLDSVVRFALALGLADQFQSLFGWQIKSIAQMEQAQSAPRQRARPRRRR
ncbi:MAG: helix-turn-helix transcriptional regulator, partial [Steroidobacteraceae bacterium]